MNAAAIPTRLLEQWKIGLCCLCFLLLAFSAPGAESILKPDSFFHYIDRFNSMEDENVTNFVSNTNSWNWLSKEIPFFECPDHEVEEMYYFRWWSFRKHLEKTPNGFVFTEFLTRLAPISSALGHHLMEGRWLHDQNYLDDYVRYWFHDEPARAQLHKYSQWEADALYQRYLVTGDKKFLTSQLTDLVRDYEQWEHEHLTTNGLFWQFDVRDAMEESISGSRTNHNLRPTINSYMFGNAQAIALIARLAGKEHIEAEYNAKAAGLRQLVQGTLWDSDAGFFEAVHENGAFANAREEIGFIPWYFELPDKKDGKFNAAWTQFADTKGFSAAYGITTAERRHPQFRSHGYGHCEWDGAVWPFATSQTLGALANVLRDYKQSTVSPRDYFDAFLTYVHSQHVNDRPYIGEYLDETTGQWINGKGDRSRFYNHSTFADLIIAGVVGLCPSGDNIVKISPLPAGTWNWFCLDGVKYHSHTLTIIWDREGTRYHLGQGLIVLADGKEIAHGTQLSEITGKLP